MSYIGRYPTGGIIPGTIDQITADVGGPVLPDISDNINIIGGTGISTDGTVANTLTISTDAVRTLTGNVGSATASANNINLLGSGKIDVVGLGGADLSFSLANFTNHTIPIGSVTGSLDSLPAATNGEVLIGNTGANPTWSTLTAGANVTITNTPGHIEIAATGGTTGIDEIIPDIGLSPVVGDGGQISVIGEYNIQTRGAFGGAVNNLLYIGVAGLTPNQIQLGSGSGHLAGVGPLTSGQLLIGRTGAAPMAATLTDGNNITCTEGVGSISIAVTGTTDHAIQTGNATGSLTSLAVGTDGQVLLAATAADAAFATLTSTGSTIVYTPGANTLNLETSAATADSFATDAGSATPALHVLTVAGGTNIGTAGAGSTVTVNLDDTITLTQVNATTFDTNVAAAGVTLSGTTLSADGTDLNIPIILTPKGADLVQISYATPNAVAVYTTSGGLDEVGPLTDGQILIGSTGNPAVAATLSNGNNITCTGGAGSISIAVTGTTQHAVQIGGAAGQLADVAVGTNGQLLCGSTGAAPEFTTLTSTGGTIAYTPGAHTLNLEATVSGGLDWSEIVDASKTIVVNEGYVANRGTLITFTLPATAALGDIFAIVGKGAGLWKIAQNAGQTIHYGNADTTAGAGGSLAATLQYDCVDLVCITENTDFVVRNSLGNLTVI